MISGPDSVSPWVSVNDVETANRPSAAMVPSSQTDAETRATRARTRSLSPTNMQTANPP